MDQITNTVNLLNNLWLYTMVLISLGLLVVGLVFMVRTPSTDVYSERIEKTHGAATETVTQPRAKGDGLDDMVGAAEDYLKTTEKT
ncbi:MAG TPA: hypothetical protein VIH52_02250 [Candidatus Nanoarchaeia archaeon]|nr:hypothetical protein [uncultured archaeon]